MSALPQPTNHRHALTHVASRVLRVLIVIMALAFTFGLVPCTTLPAWAAEPSGFNTEPRHIPCPSLSDAGQAYYRDQNSIDALFALPGATDTSNSYAAMQNNQLYDALQDLMQSTIVELPVYSGYRAGSLAYYWNYTDMSPLVNTEGMSSHFLLFYSDAAYEYPKSGQPKPSVALNREHIWPKSHASFHEQNGGSDLNHLRPSAQSINGLKDDHPFGYVDELYATGYEIGMMDGVEVCKAYADKDVFEPKDDVKGDVARILLYVYCCWGQPNLYSDVPEDQLPAPDPGDKTNTGGRVITDLDTLLAWCEYDPVDTWEMLRNDLSQQVQGNRNVFIDYPELAWRLFDRDVPPGIQTPTHLGCEHVWGEPEIVDASCIQPGITHTTCSVCGNVRTLPTPSLGHVDEDGDQSCDRCQIPTLGTFHLSLAPSAGDHLLIYHPVSGKAMTPVINSNKRLNGISTLPNGDAIIPALGTCVFHVVPASESSFYLVSEGKYLATTAQGSKLLWQDEADEFSTWLFEPADADAFYIVSENASFYSAPQAIEFFDGSFTVFSLSGGNPFAFRLYTTSEHTWKEVSRTESSCSEAGTIELSCVACGATGQKTLATLPHSLTQTEAREATCTEAGNIGYWTCSECGKVFADEGAEREIAVEDTAVPALGHSWGAWVVTKEATETEAGEKTRTCKNDPTHVQTRTIPPSGNSDDDDEEDDDEEDAEEEEEEEPATQTYTITYDLAGGNYNGSTDKIVEMHKEGTVITIHAAPSRDGFAFAYWQGSRHMPGDSYTVTQDHTFTAAWEKKEEPVVTTNIADDDSASSGQATQGKQAGGAITVADGTTSGQIARSERTGNATTVANTGDMSVPTSVLVLVTAAGLALVLWGLIRGGWDVARHH